MLDLRYASDILDADHVFDAFVEGFISTGLWCDLYSAYGERIEHSGGGSFDGSAAARHWRARVADEAGREMRSDCEDFWYSNARDLVVYLAARGAAAAGHDFWLTRNGHGAGFWDRGLGPVGERLADAAKVYGGTSLYVGDDGKVHGA